LSAEKAYENSKFKSAAAEGFAVIRSGGSLTCFEKLCDDAVVEYLKKARGMNFGEAPMIAFLAAKEAEIVSVRTIVSGRLAGVPNGEIRERLRETYV
jgi:V/A-type H+-transporting ATPase subunit C